MLRTTRFVISAGLVSSAALAACTFGGLADYDVAQCDPNIAKQSEDLCERLNAKEPSTCTPYQCDAASRHCVRRPRDDDRDGDPAATCGGADCVDSDPAQSSKAQEICDSKDNDCDSFIDEDAIKPGVTRPVQVTSGLGNESDPSLNRVVNGFLASYVLSSAQGACFPLIPLNRNSTGALATGCSMLANERSFAPRQPLVAQVGGGFGAVFVVTSTCATGRLGYRFQTTTSLGAELGCDATHPTTLPNIGLFPSGGATIPGLVAWYEASPAERADPVSACSTAKPTKLNVLNVGDLKDAASLKSAFDYAKLQTVSQTATSVYPPAFASAGEDKLLLASPEGTGVAVWVFSRSATAAPQPISISGFDNARSANIATALDGTTTRVAVASETGCAPKQSVKVALGTLTETGLSFDKTLDVAVDAPLATHPAVVWIPQRGGEWWVTWITSGPSAELRRYRADGTPVGGSVRLGKKMVLGAAASGDGSPAFYGFDQAEANGAFVEIPLTCGN